MTPAIRVAIILAAIGAAAPARAQAPCTTVLECAQRALEAAEEAKRTAALSTPAGAVMAFNRDDCPAGWKRLEEANGRVIVGMAPDLARGAKGGRRDIPADGSHEHPVRAGHAPGGGRFGNDNADDHWATGPAGQHAHGGDNMPPYLALLYCERL